MNIVEPYARLRPGIMRLVMPLAVSGVWNLAGFACALIAGDQFDKANKGGAIAVALMCLGCFIQSAASTIGNYVDSIALEVQCRQRTKE